MNQLTQQPRYSHNIKILPTILKQDVVKNITVGLLLILIVVFATSFEISAKQITNNLGAVVSMQPSTKQLVNNSKAVIDIKPNTNQIENSADVVASIDSRLDTSITNIEPKSIPSTKQATQRVNTKTKTNKETATANNHAQRIVAKQLRATFRQTTFTNLEPSPIDGWYQAQISNQIIYFNPTQELMFFGELYTKNGISLSQQTRNKWQAKRVSMLDISDVLVIGSGAVEIIEFTDTDCPFCQRFNSWIRAKNNTYQKTHGTDLFTRKIVLTPIDALHPNAHREAVHILCQSSDKREDAITQSLAGQIASADMARCQKGKDGLLKHREIAQDFGVSATPTVVINGQIIQGFNKPRLEAIIKEQLNKIGTNNTQQHNNIKEYK